jgi:hypothetical protein
MMIQDQFPDSGDLRSGSTTSRLFEDFSKNRDGELANLGAA